MGIQPSAPWYDDGGSGARIHRSLPARMTLLGLVGLLTVVLLPAPGTAATSGPAGTASKAAPSAATTAAASDAAVRSLGPACLRAPGERFPDVYSVHQPGVDCIGWWGVASGDAEGRYEPRRPVRREQLASFIDRTLTLTGTETQGAPTVAFDDLVGGVHDGAIARLTALGVVGGVAPQRFDPTGTVTRAQMGTFLARFLALLVDEGALAYPPADPVPLPEDDDPFGRILGQPTTPVRGEALPGAGGAGPIPVPATPPAILASLPVELQPGEQRRIRVPLPSPLADVVYWFDPGPGTTSFADGSCPEPGGRGIGTASGITTTFGDALLSGLVAPDRDGCLRGSIWSYAFARTHNGDVVEILVDNAGTQRFRSQLHVAQGPVFTPIVHSTHR